MKSAHRQTFYAAVILGLIAFQQGCTTISDVVLDSTDYIVSENSKVEKLHVVTIAIQQHLIPAGPRKHFLLVDELPSPKDEWKLRSLVSDTVEWRRVDLLYNVATAMIYDHPLRGDEESSTRWILSLHPLIIAMGDAKENAEGPFGPSLDADGKIRVGATYHLVTSKDLAREVKRIYILDHWPKEIWSMTWEKYGKARRVIEFPKPRAIADVLTSMPAPPESVSHHSPSAADSAH